MEVALCIDTPLHLRRGSSALPRLLTTPADGQ
ncbi:hypothetical protein BN439_1022 [Erwinia amylovora Ea644]|uniref:Uncharacterized protein n=3 Tax=Erwinia amylovora TaxID=552 RepID=A0A831A1S9_ERWAM|nr:hypothetical protein EaACW_0763 [Erwinia amylovora ACW56400]QJQ55523.1 hypothetical protein EHX00_2823 [Erwinia amylovora]CBA19706.1 hypothetical protein predicted by Glimmer/Critica [Erwinia amylovora CFBP1430]CBX79602.1 hypothetical protein predicted by Glimmer/Critica [Erwinia amylovora ATCC BAA-2158]CCO77610.1 hypothetical protein BN432_0783 [Erwinia amylovora Ea356]CCO81394.1 hypothetical protein BN433_0793 [Erwinia amylovora Ea266]CCO85198.1 hypothetical protein BN434_0781 [Erwinia a